MRRHRSARQLCSRSDAPPNIAARGWARRWFTRTSRVPIPIRFPTTKNFTRRTQLREKEAHRDPIPKFGLFLVREGIVDEKELEALEADVDREIREATDQALLAEPPAKESILVNVYSPDVDPTSSQFEAAPHFSGEPRDHGRNGFRHARRRNGAR